jgi:hypothetical protein
LTLVLRLEGTQTEHPLGDPTVTRAHAGKGRHGPTGWSSCPVKDATVKSEDDALDAASQTLDRHPNAYRARIRALLTAAGLTRATVDRFAARRSPTGGWTAATVRLFRTSECGVPRRADAGMG